MLCRRRRGLISPLDIELLCRVAAWINEVAPLMPGNEHMGTAPA